MSNGIQTNAMAEIALALAMGFFSIMILAMVSMGAASQAGCPRKSTMNLGKGLEVAATESRNKSQTSNKKDTGPLVKLENLLIFFNGNFFNGHLQRIDPVTFVKNKGRVILAVSAQTSFIEVTAARQRVPTENVTVTVLDEEWTKIVKEKHHANLEN